MSRRKQQNTAKRTNKQQREEQWAVKNDKLFRELTNWFVPPGELFHKGEFHGNVKWNAEDVMVQALIWSWQEAKNVTDAFDQTREICDDLKLIRSIVTYTAFMNALTRHRELSPTNARSVHRTTATARRRSTERKSPKACVVHATNRILRSRRSLRHGSP